MLAYALFAVLFHPAALHIHARQITVVNSCSSTVWPALFTGGADVPSQPTGWELDSGQSTSFSVSDDWTAGRIWARTGCTTDSSGTLQCLSGDCGGSGLTWYVNVTFFLGAPLTAVQWRHRCATCYSG